MQKVTGEDGREYIELNGCWYQIQPDGRLVTASRPSTYTNCEVFTKDKEKDFFLSRIQFRK